MKRNLKPVPGENLHAYWLRCGGRFGEKWYGLALKYMRKNGTATWDGRGWIAEPN